MSVVEEVERAVCECGRPARGQVAADGVAPAHLCRQCGPEHCKLREYIGRHRAVKDEGQGGLW